MLLVKPMSIKLVLEPVPVLMFRVTGPVAGTMTIIPMWFTVILRHTNLSATQRYLGKISDVEAMRWIENLYA